MSLFGHFFAKLSAHVFKFIFQLNLFGDGHTVIGDGWGAKFLVQYNVSALWSKGYFYGIGQFVHSVLQRSAGFVCILHLFCHFVFPPYFIKVSKSF